MNGDIFVLVLDAERNGEEELQRLRALLRHSYASRGVEVELSACICRIESNCLAQNESDLIKSLEYAVGEAKSWGKGQYYELGETDIKSMQRKVAIEQALIEAIENRHFEVHYQPIYDIKAHRFHSLEALARLNVPGYGYVSPEEFIRIAEQEGMIVQLGILVLEEVCRLLSRGGAAGTWHFVCRGEFVGRAVYAGGNL